MTASEKSVPTEKVEPDEYFDIRRGELAVQQDEIAARREDSNNRKEIALAVVQARKEDTANAREHHRNEAKSIRRFTLLFTALAMAFVVILIYMGEAKMVQTLLIEGLKILVGAFGGWGFAVYRYSKNRRADNDE